MVSAVGIDAPQAAAMVTLHVASTYVRTPQAAVMIPYNVPTPNMEAAQAAAQVVETRIPAFVRVPQAAIMVVCDGRTASPQIRSFTITLDGHNLYVLRLGDIETIVYDTSTKQWVDWDSYGLPFWRANCGINWVGANKIGFENGNTNIVIGDDVWGLLWFLAPKQQFDDSTDELNPPQLQQVPFVRVAMAQTVINGRDFQPCYAVFLSGDNYGITSDFVPYIQLETSDDQGRSWINHGVITAQPDILDQDYRWTSLGQMQSPGRLFRLTDNGILTRLDNLEMNDDAA
jgi:hypothetical protein